MKQLALVLYQFILLDIAGCTPFEVATSPASNESLLVTVNEDLLETLNERPGRDRSRADSAAWLVVLIHADGRIGCAGGALAARWLVTAAHCLGSCAGRARTRSGDAPVLACYRHAAAHAAVDARGAVRALRHDIGLVSTTSDLVATSPPLWLDNPRVNIGEEVFVHGLEDKSGEWRPLEWRVRVSPCPSPGWRQVLCGREAAGARRLCHGDSGSPVHLRGALLAVVSMGPLGCGAPARAPAAAFTLLHRHRDALLGTMNASGDREAPMLRVMAATPSSAPPRKAGRSCFLSLVFLLAIA